MGLGLISEAPLTEKRYKQSVNELLRFKTVNMRALGNLCHVISEEVNIVGNLTSITRTVFIKQNFSSTKLSNRFM
jgi:CRISPR/Cas system endoribonuclease Cas6 (RAMP superfamily)